MLALSAAMLLPHPAAAVQGVSIDIGRVSIGDPVLPATPVDLPAFSVANPGDEPTSYVMHVGGLEGNPNFSPDPAWIAFSPAEFTLAEGGSQTVTARLEVPAGASAGTYAGLIKAEIRSSGAGSLVGGAAGAHLSFDVAATSPRGSSALGTTTDGPPEALGLAIGGALATLLGGLALWGFGRRYRISIGRR